MEKSNYPAKDIFFDNDTKYPYISDYRGFRLIAMSVLPISSKTIVYGSSDGGQTVHCNPSFHEQMRKAALKFNIKEHMSGIGEKKFLFG